LPVADARDELHNVQGRAPTVDGTSIEAWASQEEVSARRIRMPWRMAEATSEARRVATTPMGHAPSPTRSSIGAPTTARHGSPPGMWAIRRVKPRARASNRHSAGSRPLPAALLGCHAAVVGRRWASAPNSWPSWPGRHAFPRGGAPSLGLAHARPPSVQRHLDHLSRRATVRRMDSPAHPTRRKLSLVLRVVGVPAPLSAPARWSAGPISSTSPCGAPTASTSGGWM
jgi:hypothetical protein